MKVSIVVPAYNEAGDLPQFINDLILALDRHSETKDFEIVIVGDNSSDGTPALIDGMASKDRHIIPVHGEDNRGYAGAVKCGLKKAAGDVIVVAGTSDDPDDIHLLLAKIEEGYDIVYGSRFCKGGSADGYPWRKMMADRLLNGSVRLLFGIRHTDITNAFKAYRRAVIGRISIDDLEAADLDLEIEISLKAYILGFKSAEVPVSWHRPEQKNADLKLCQGGYSYGTRLLKLFVMGNLVSLKDILSSMLKGSPVYVIIATLLGLLLLTGILSVAGFSRVLSIISGISAVFLLISCMMILATFVLRAWRCSVLLRTSGYSAHMDTIIKCYFFGFFINYLLPMGIGDFMRAFALKTTEKVPISICLPAFIVEGTMDMLALAGIMIAALLMISGYDELYELVWFSLFLSIGMIIGIFLLYNADRFARRFYDRFESLEKNITTFKAAMRQMAKNPAAIALCFILTVAIWLVEISSIYFASRAVNLDLSVALTLVSGAASFIAEAIPLTPAGIGIHEGAIAGALYLFGIEVSAGTSIALIDHFARGLVTCTFGMVSMIHIGFASRSYFVSNKRSANMDNIEQLPLPVGLEK